MDEQTYSIADAMKRLGCSRDTIYRWMNDGRLAYFYIGDRRRISEGAIKAFLDLGAERAREEIEEKKEMAGLARAA